MPESCVVVYVTAPKGKPARALAKKIIESRKAACVNVVPAVESFYWWKGKVEAEGEALLIIKTRKRALKALEKVVRSNHPYDVPEFIALPISGGAAPYMTWLRGEVS